MSKWLKTLAKIGLVELEDGDVSEKSPTKAPSPAEELDALQAQLEGLVEAQGRDNVAQEEEPEPVAIQIEHEHVPMPKTSTTSDGAIAIRETGTIFSEAGITASPYPIERMIKLLDGLKAMPKDMRLRAIQAMDQADDSWTIEDSILDGQRKRAALQAEEARIQGLLRQREDERAQESIAQDRYIEQVTSEIRTQIDELEAMLEEELRDAASKKATIEAQLEADRAAFESARRAIAEQVDTISGVLSALQND